MKKKQLIGLATASILLLSTSSTTQAQALGDQWYIGAGAGVSFLKPKADDELDARELETDQSTIGHLFIGRDFDHLSSGQLQLYSLGEAEFVNGQTAEFQGAEAALMYRFYDSRDNRRGRPVRGTAFYGRFGVGFLERDSEIELKNDTPVYFGIGAGLETYLNYNLGARLEAQYFDTDAAAATLSLVVRFGGYRNKLLSSIELPTQQPDATVVAQTETIEAQPIRPTTADTATRADTTVTDATADVELFDTTDESNYIARIPLAPTENEAIPQPDVTPETNDSASVDSDIQENIPSDTEQTAMAPIADTTELDSVAEPSAVEPLTTEAPSELTQPSATTSKFIDSDSDGIVDDNDKCPDSTAGFPVNLAGCGVLQGALTGLRFSDDQSVITESASNTLDSFARLLEAYPSTRIEIVAHTDTTGNEDQQSDRTRSRLRAIGTYLVERGATADQLILRSFGGKRPVADNSTAAGREANNRIEVFERPR